MEDKLIERMTKYRQNKEKMTMKGIYEVLHYTWINDKVCDTVVHDRELHYGEIPPRQKNHKWITSKRNRR